MSLYQVFTAAVLLTHMSNAPLQSTTEVVTKHDTFVPAGELAQSTPHSESFALQNSPVSAAQAVVPQAQVAGLAAEPFVLVQDGIRLQVSVADMQNSPVSAAQAVVPQAQLASLAAEPFVLVQDGIRLQVSVADVQNSPVESVQTLV